MFKRTTTIMILCAMLAATPIFAAAQSVTAETAAVEPGILIEEPIEMPVIIEPSGSAENELEADAQGLTDAINAAKRVTGETSDYEDFSHYSYTYGEDVLVYQLSWNGSKTEQPSIEMTVGADGSVYSYYKYYDYWQDTVALPERNKSEILDIAYDFAQKCVPEYEGTISKDYARVKYNRYGSYSVIFDRVAFGYTVAENYIRVNLTSDGKIYSFSADQMASNVTAPESADTASSSVIAEAFKKNLPLKAVYRSFWNEDTEKYGVCLVYSLPDESGEFAVDAATGRPLTLTGKNEYGIYGYEPAPTIADAVMESSSAAKGYVMTEAEQNAVDMQDSFVTAADILAILGKLDGVVQREYKFQSNRVYGVESQYGDSVEYHIDLSLSFTDDETGETMKAYLTAEAESGRIISFHSYDYNNKFEARENTAELYAEGEKAARVLLATIYGELADSYTLTSAAPLDTDRLTYFDYSFVREVNGIPFENDTAQITMIPETQIAVQFSFTYTKDAVFSDPKGAISADSAADRYFAAVGLKPFWITAESVEGDTLKVATVIKSGAEKTLELVYTYGENIMIDAFSGMATTYGGERYVKPASQYYTPTAFTDIARSPYAEAVKALSDADIIEAGGRFYPKRQIKTGELVDMIDNLNSGYYYDATQAEDYDENAAITRQDAIKMLIDYLGYGEIAALDIYKCPLSDADKLDADCYGSVAIAYGMGILDIFGDKLNPTAALTREEAAAIVFAYLKTR